MAWQRLYRTLRPGRHKGSALLIVLWALTIVSAAVLGLAIYFQDSMEEEAGRSAAFRCGQLAESGLAVALHPEVQPGDPVLNQQFPGLQGFEARIVSEGSRININAVLQKPDLDFLWDLFTRWGLELKEAQNLTDALADWIDADDLRRLNGAERQEYEAAGRPGSPRNRPFETVEELALVLGWDRIAELKPDWANVFTVWGSGRIDVNEASAEILEVATESGEIQVEDLISYRNGSDGIPYTEDDMPLESLDQVRSILGKSEIEFQRIADRLSVEDAVTRIESTGKVGNSSHGSNLPNSPRTPLKNEQA
jgi:general secretion pathway protein K